MKMRHLVALGMLACCGVNWCASASAQANFALQPGDGRIVTVAQLRTPGVHGLTIRFRRGTSVAYVDECVARCHQAQRPYTLLVMAGSVGNPTSEASMRELERIIANLGARYALDPLCWGVHGTVTPYDGPSEELDWGKPMSQAAKNANKRALVAWHRAFPRQTKILAVFGKDAPAMRELIDFGAVACEGTLLVKNNSLKASTDVYASHSQLVVYAGRRGCMIGWEMVCSVTQDPRRFGGTLQQAFDKARIMALQAGQPISYLAIYPPDLPKLGGVG